MEYLISTTGLCARIHRLPGREPFMLAADLAEAYETSTKRIVEQVKRNPDRFPPHHAFRLTEAEMMTVRSQNATELDGRDAPLAFTRAGATGLSAVLKTAVAARVHVIMNDTFSAMEKQAFDQMRYTMLSLQIEVKARSALRVKLIDGINQGMAFDAIWRMTGASKPKLAKVARECVALGLIDALPVGTPEPHPDLFLGMEARNG